MFLFKPGLLDSLVMGTGLDRSRSERVEEIQCLRTLKKIALHVHVTL